MVVKLSRKCGCKRKTRNKQTKRGKTMKGGSRGSHPGSVRVSHVNISRMPSIPGSQQPGTKFTPEYAHMFRKPNQPKTILNTEPAFKSRTGPVYVPRVNTKSSA